MIAGSKNENAGSWAKLVKRFLQKYTGSPKVQM